MRNSSFQDQNVWRDKDSQADSFTAISMLPLDEN